MPIVALAGAINGVNLTFTTPWAYAPGTVAVFLNGQLLSRNDGAHPWVETSPALGVITLNGADYIPRPNDSLFAFASMFGESLAQELVVGEIYALLQSESNLAAFIADESIIATISTEFAIAAFSLEDKNDLLIEAETQASASLDNEAN